MSSLETSSLYQLTLTRMKLTLREPEAIFWIFVFPILLAVGLGIAFRNRPPDVLPVGATTAQLEQALAADKGLKEGDVILEVAGKSVSTPADVREMITAARTDGKHSVLIRLKSGDNTRFVALPVGKG